MEGGRGVVSVLNRSRVFGFGRYNFCLKIGGFVFIEV